MRLTVTIEEYSLIQLSLENYQEKIDDHEVTLLKEKLEKQFKQSFVTHSLKRNATKKATYVKMDRTKDKIRNAINLMNLENQKITINAVSKKADVSYNSVKKYSYLLQLDITE
jgi:L-fucose isomerase-like protein